MSNPRSLSMEARRNAVLAEGARCDLCPLGPQGCLRGGATWAPVPSYDGAMTSEAVLLGSMPSEDDEVSGIPFTGDHGGIVNEALRQAGWQRSLLRVATVLPCRMPGPSSSQWERMERALRVQRASRAQELLATGEESTKSAAQRRAAADIPHPLTCCSAHIEAAVAPMPSAPTWGVVTLGKEALAVLSGTAKPVLDVRGDPTTFEATPYAQGTRYLATVHPAFVGAAPGYRPVLAADLAKARRWFRGELQWTAPTMLWNPTPAELAAWLDQPASYWTWDLETDGTEVLECNIRCIGIMRVPPEGADPSQPLDGCLLSIRSRDDSRVFLHPDRVIQQWYAVLKSKFFLDPNKLKAGHNIIGFDIPIVERELGITPTPVLDTILLTRQWGPDLRRGLGTVGSILTDIGDWKSDHEGNKLAIGARTDLELAEYCNTDNAVEAHIVPPLFEAADAAGYTAPLREDLRPRGWPRDRPWTLLEVDHFGAEQCATMHRIGIPVNQTRLLAHELRLTNNIKASKAAVATLVDAVLNDITGGATRMASLAGKAVKGKEAGFNPNSTQQLAKLLYDVCSLVPPKFTDLGDPSTDDEALRALWMDSNTPASVRRLILALRKLRKDVKSLGSFVLPLRLRNPYRPTDGGLVFIEDGRLHAPFRGHGTSVGRYSSGGKVVLDGTERAGFNLQTAPLWLRDVFEAPEGYSFIGGDFDQLHPRIIANVWGVRALLEDFTQKRDPYGRLAADVMGERYTKAEGWGVDPYNYSRKPADDSDAAKIRHLFKVTRLTGAYHGSIPVIWDSIVSTENKNGDLIFADITLRQVTLIYERWMQEEPEYPAAWDAAVARYNQNGGYLESLLFRRRSGALDGGSVTAAPNYEILSTETDIARMAEIDYAAEMPADENTGMCAQVHDSLLALVRKEEEDRARDVMMAAMNRTIPGWTVQPTAKVRIGRTAADVK